MKCSVLLIRTDKYWIKVLKCFLATKLVLQQVGVKRLVNAYPLVCSFIVDDHNVDTVRSLKCVVQGVKIVLDG